MEKNISFGGSIPENYDKFLGPFIFEPYALDIKERVSDGKFDNVVELAAGTGRVTKYLREALPKDSKLTATDINPDMLSIARQKFPEENIQWEQVDMQEIPFADSTFDLAVSQFGIMFVPDKPKAYKETYRVLKPGGKLLFNVWDSTDNNPFFNALNKVLDKYFGTEPNPFYKIPFSYFNEDEIKKHLKEAGFKNIKITAVKKDGVSKSAEEAAKGFAAGTPTSALIMDKDPNLMPEIEKEASELLSHHFGNNPMKCDLRALIIEAEK